MNCKFTYLNNFIKIIYYNFYKCIFCGLDLSINKLSRTIPGDIATRIPFATSVILVSNEFSREIPVSLANCTFLNTLKLDQNRLTGQIPPQFGVLSRIKAFSVSNNLLMGPVPIFSAGVLAFSPIFCCNRFQLRCNCLFS